jgi:hypothetical protein
VREVRGRYSRAELTGAGAGSDAYFATVHGRDLPRVQPPLAPPRYIRYTTTRVEWTHINKDF